MDTQPTHRVWNRKLPSGSLEKGAVWENSCAPGVRREFGVGPVRSSCISSFKASAMIYQQLRAESRPEGPWKGSCRRSAIVMGRDWRTGKLPHLLRFAGVCRETPTESRGFHPEFETRNRLVRPC